ncbi:hypothetical protein GCM10010520_63610 [Rhizobium viscosum]
MSSRQRNVRGGNIRAAAAVAAIADVLELCQGLRRVADLRRKLDTARCCAQCKTESATLTTQVYRILKAPHRGNGISVPPAHQASKMQKFGVAPSVSALSTIVHALIDALTSKLDLIVRKCRMSEHHIPQG